MIQCQCGRFFFSTGETDCSECAAARAIVDAGNARHLALPATPLFAAPKTIRGQLDMGA